jgi:hypothetical protein
MVYQPRYFLKNLPKYENLGRNGIWRQSLQTTTDEFGGCFLNKKMGAESD